MGDSASRFTSKKGKTTGTIWVTGDINLLTKSPPASPPDPPSTAGVWISRAGSCIAGFLTCMCRIWIRLSRDFMGSGQRCLEKAARPLKVLVVF